MGISKVNSLMPHSLGFLSPRLGLWMGLSPSPLRQLPFHTVGHTGLKLAGYFSPEPPAVTGSEAKASEVREYVKMASECVW